MSHFVAYILQFQEIIVYKIPPGGGRGSIASLRSILTLPFRPLYNNMSLLSLLRFLRDSHFKCSRMPVMLPVSKL